MKDVDAWFYKAPPAPFGRQLFRRFVWTLFPRLIFSESQVSHAVAHQGRIHADHEAKCKVYNTYDRVGVDLQSPSNSSC
jgi:hypothetical protein